MAKITYFMKGGRKQRLDKVNNGSAPEEFLYGYNYIKNRFQDVELIENIELKKRNSVIKKIVKIFDLIFYKRYGFSRPVHLFFGEKILDNMEILIAVPDSNTFAALEKKISSKSNVKIIGFVMGSAFNLLKLITAKPKHYKNIYKKICSWISASEILFILGYEEYKFYKSEFPMFENKFRFLPFGIDIDFWNYNSEGTNRDKIIFIGNDRNRNYELLIDIINTLPDEKFTLVTNNKFNTKLPKNVELISGSWHNEKLTDIEMRQLFESAFCCILPIKDTIQPSGQSVALQSMASGCPVIISNFKGIWDYNKISNLKDLIIVENDINKWVKSINKIKNDENFRKVIISNARKLVEENYSSKKFNFKLEEKIQEILNYEKN